MIEKQQIGLWTDALASGAPVPGGGGASALAGALAAALGQMVVNLTVGKKRYADVEERMREELKVLDELRLQMLHLSDRDAEVFAPLAAAYGLPAGTEEERAEKDRVMEENLRAASLVPMEMMEVSLKILEILEFLGEKGSRMAVSDVGVAAQMARAALNGAIMNVYINTKSMKDRKTAEEWNRKAQDMAAAGSALADRIYDGIAAQLKGI